MFVAKPDTQMKLIIKAVAQHLGKCKQEIQLVHSTTEQTAWSWCVLKDLTCETGDIFRVNFLQVGGKPVIYLLPPSGTSIDAEVSLSLSSAWLFSAIYPLVSVKQSTAPSCLEEISWSVVARDDGTLHDKATNSDVAYLYWEAK